MKKTRTVLVGRHRETEELLAGLEGAASGRGKLFLIDGEPGIGKTRLVEDLASRAGERGAFVLWSRCWEASGAPAYWPWIQLVRSCLRGVVGSDFYTLAESAIFDISQLLPEACEVAIDGKASRVPLEPEEMRFRLFDAVRSLIKTAASLRPLVLVLDDLGAADLPSLLLLRFLASELYDCRVLIVATYRDSELRSSPALAESMGDLAREAEGIRLRGLSRDEVGALIESQTLSTPEPDAIDAVFRATGGNPFFILSILKLVPVASLAEIDSGLSSARFKLSSGFGAAIEGHLAPLSANARRILMFAALMGREFDAAVLAKVASGTVHEVVELLTEALEAGLITSDPDFPQHYEFVHSIIRDALYQGVPVADRPDLHERIGIAIEELCGSDTDSHLTDLAYHFFEAARLGSSERGLDYAQAAAERAMEMAAFEESARCYQMALSAIRPIGGFDARRRCELLLALGEAQNRSADYTGSRDTFCQAADLAEHIGDREMLAHAALGYPGLQWSAPANANEESIRLLERALRAFPKKNDDEWRAMLMARLASELYYRPAAQQRRTALAEEAVEIARRTGDKRALLAILGHRDLTLSGPDSLEERFKNAEEMTQVAEELGSYLGLYLGFLSRTIYFRHLGQLSKAETEAEAMTLIARVTRLPVCSWGAQCFAASRALLEGRYQEGERLARECLRFAERMRGRDAADLFWPVAIAPLREQGRLSELEPLALAAAGQRRDLPAYRALLALIYVGLGDMRRARTEFELLAMRGFIDIPRDNTFLACATALAEVCAALNDGSRAVQLMKLLEPYAHLSAVFGPLGGFGAVARYLGMLATTAARFQEAEAFFEQGLAINRANQALPFVAYTETEYAAMLLRRGSQRDVSRALEFLSSAERLADALGMKALKQRIDALGHVEESRSPAHSAMQLHAADAYDATMALDLRPDISAPGPYDAKSNGNAAHLTDDQADRPSFHYTNGKSAIRGDAVFRRDGDFWTISYEGRVVRLKHVKGLACLAYLLGHPEAEIHSSNLAAVMHHTAAESGAATANFALAQASSTVLNDAGPVLDDRAKNDYRRRLSELREDLERARDMNDLSRTEQIEEEIDFIVAELSRAVGMGGRDRRACSPSERARLNVTKAIKAVLMKIAQHNSDLGRHLDATVRTGTFCSYKPDPNSRISWKLG